MIFLYVVKLYVVHIVGPWKDLSWKDHKLFIVKFFSLGRDRSTFWVYLLSTTSSSMYLSYIEFRKTHCHRRFHARAAASVTNGNSGIDYWGDKIPEPFENQSFSDSSSWNSKPKAYGKGISRLTRYWSILPICSVSNRSVYSLDFPISHAMLKIRSDIDLQKFHCNLRSISNIPVIKVRTIMEGPDWGMYMTQINLMSRFDS